METAHLSLASLIRNLEVRSPLSEEDCQAILHLPYKIRVLEPASYIVGEGDPPQRSCVLLTGLAYRQKLTGDGARQIVALHLPGEGVDFQNLLLGVSDHNVQMLTQGVIAEISRSAFLEVMAERPAVMRAIMLSTLVDASISREWVLNVGRRCARSRISHLLCEFASRQQQAGLAEKGCSELPMTQEQLADATGLTPVHVNRILKSLERDGLILRSRRTLSFPDWYRLQEVADFNRRYLHFTDGMDQSERALLVA